MNSSVFKVNGSNNVNCVFLLQPPENSSRPAAKISRRTSNIEEAMMNSTEELDHEMMDVISNHLGEGWKNVLRNLNYTDGQIEQSIIDNQIQGGVKEVIYKLLQDWTNNAKDGEATLGAITQILLKSKQGKCVKKMIEVWKHSTSQPTA